MRKINTTQRLAFYFASIAVMAFVVYVVVYAQSSSTIQGCYTNGNGSLRRVNSASDCKNSETPISWNITGPQGLTGETGPQGPAGPQGPPGADATPLTDHHQHIEVTQLTSASFSFALSKVDVPTFVLVGVSGVEVNGVARPSAFAYGSFLLDSTTGRTTGFFPVGVGTPGPAYEITYHPGTDNELGTLTVQGRSGPGDPPAVITSPQVTWRVVMTY